MSNKVVVDDQCNGWAKNNEKSIRQKYADIRYVGEIPNLPAGCSDAIVAAYCIKNDCDLLTYDKRAYTYWLEQDGVDKVHISMFDMSTYQISIP